MARGRGLYRAIAEPDNLRQAFRKAVRGKSDRHEVIAFRADLDNNLALLRTELLTGDVGIGPNRFFTILDPKERVICAAPFHDRVLHHAVMNLCEPVFERYSIFDSCACRPDKGLHRALHRAQEFSRSSPWFLKLDIRKYFDSIHHVTLLWLLAKRFRDRRLLELFEKVITSYESTPGRGLPIGNLLSQHFANFYLGLLDHWLLEERQASGYLRYMDDFLIFGPDREFLKDELKVVEQFLAGRLHLSLKNNCQINQCSRGIPFLGFRVFPHIVRLAPRSRLRFITKLHDYEHAAQMGLLVESALARRVASLVSFTSVAAAAGFRRAVIERQRTASEGARTASIAAAAGTTNRRTYGRPIATTTPRTTVTTTLDSGSCPQLTGVADTTR